MKAVFLMFDSLNLRFLSCYGGKGWVQTPNFQRLAERTTAFDSAFVCSMPCMPARREIHTGRSNFLHRSWGPIEPFDDSMPQMLKERGVYTHLISDHHHYWEDGGATYHSRYNSWEIVRGQEYDRWKGEVADPDIPEHIGKDDKTASDWLKQFYVNRKHMPEEADHPLARTFTLGEQFIRANAEEDNWMLQIENFSPHEPFDAVDRFRNLYGLPDGGPEVFWPRYGHVRPEDQLDRVEREYAALVTMCDEYLGRFLDLMDELNLWNDTMLIVTTDHGFMLGEKEWMAKCWMPFYNEVARIPFFVWDPRHGGQGTRCGALVQMTDVAPTLLDWFGAEVPSDMTGLNLHDVMTGDASRSACLYGIFGAHVNCTDGRYVYMRAAQLDQPLFHYTLMPMHSKTLFTPEELADAALHEPFSFTKGCPVLKVPAKPFATNLDNRTLLFDLQDDPEQLRPLEDPELEQKMITKMKNLMAEQDAPAELYNRLGF